MAGWLHGVFVGDWLFVFPLCGFSLSLFCNYRLSGTVPIEIRTRSTVGTMTWEPTVMENAWKHAS